MNLVASFLTAALSLAPPDGAELLRLPPLNPPVLGPDSLPGGQPMFGPSAPVDVAMDDFVAVGFEEDDLPGTRFQANWLVGGGSDAFGVFDFDANHSWLLGYDDWPPWTITPGLGFHVWSGPQTLDLPPRVYDAYLDIHWNPINRDRWGLSLGVIPGWYGDFEIWDGHTFQLTGWTLANFRVHDRLQILAGLAYTRQLTSNLLPIGGLLWSPNDETRLELLIPKSKLTRKLFDSDRGSTWVYLAGQLGGGTWAVADSPGSNVLVTYNDLRVVIGIEGFRNDGCECSVEIGYVFARDISVDSVTVYSPQDTVSLQAILAF